MQTNYYKCFIARAWGLLSGTGIGALIHEDGVFDDPKGGGFRRVRPGGSLAVINSGMNCCCSPNVHDQKNFSVNVFRAGFRS